MPQHDAGQCFHFNILERRALSQGEFADLLLGEFDIGDRLRRQRADNVSNLFLAQLEARWIPIVELRREFAHGFVFARRDICQDAAHGRLDLGIGVRLLLDRLAALDVLNWHSAPQSLSILWTVTIECEHHQPLAPVHAQAQSRRSRRQISRASERSAEP